MAADTFELDKLLRKRSPYVRLPGDELIAPFRDRTGYVLTSTKKLNAEEAYWSYQRVHNLLGGKCVEHSREHMCGRATTISWSEGVEQSNGYVMKAVVQFEPEYKWEATAEFWAKWPDLGCIV